MKSYIQLEKELEQIFQINNAVNILYWDISTNMPSRASSSRKKEITNLMAIAHLKLKSEKIRDLLKEVTENISDLNIWQLANLREIERRFLHAECIDDDLQNRISSATAECEYVWRIAKKDSDYNKLKPYLQEVLSATKEIALIKSKKFNMAKYDTLLDKFDPNRKCADIKQTYNFLKTRIPNLINEIIEKQRTETILPITDLVSIDKQKLISKRIMEVMGFDFTRGRIDESEHPFCGGTPHDVRLTIRYDNNLINDLMKVIHETGHGLYEQSLPSFYRDQPVGKAKGMAIHESQSLLMEMQIGRSREFIEYLSKLLKDEFGFIGPEYSSDNLYKIITRVKPNFIRLDADEVTYTMHVILRFEIEEALINDDLMLDDLPEYWGSKMQEYLGISPTSDRVGCLQDIHWTKGYFGYFPVYTNGAIIASMLMKKTKQINLDIAQDLKIGNFRNLNKFLDNNVRCHGSLKPTDELIRDATGEGKINPQIFLDYLENKYLN